MNGKKGAKKRIKIQYESRTLYATMPNLLAATNYGVALKIISSEINSKERNRWQVLLNELR
jgi:hypothetical protein